VRNNRIHYFITRDIMAIFSESGFFFPLLFN